MTDAVVEKFVADAQALARHFGDRQNSDSTLTAREATRVVNLALDVSNLLEQMVRHIKQKETECRTQTSSTQSPT